MDRIKTAINCAAIRIRYALAYLRYNLVSMKFFVLLCFLMPIIVVVVYRIERDSISTIIVNGRENETYVHYMNKTETKELINFLTDFVIFDQCPREIVSREDRTVSLNEHVRILCNKRFKPVSMKLYTMTIREPGITYLYRALVKAY